MSKLMKATKSVRKHQSLFSSEAISYPEWQKMNQFYFHKIVLLKWYIKVYVHCTLLKVTWDLNFRTYNFLIFNSHFLYSKWEMAPDWIQQEMAICHLKVSIVSICFEWMSKGNLLRCIWFWKHITKKTRLKYHS